MSNYYQSSPLPKAVNNRKDAKDLTDKTTTTEKIKTAGPSSSCSPKQSHNIDVFQASHQSATYSNPTPHKPTNDDVNGTPKYVTGWTPLISKYNNDQVVTYSSPNNKMLYQSLTGVNSSAVGLSSGLAIQGNGDIDYAQGLSLTPFITHNLQSNVTNSGGGLGQFTPFHDKSLHLTDFFIDSPIRQTPLRDLDTITPSKFKLKGEKKPSVKQLIFENARNGKRSINQVDTPPRPSHKISNSGAKIKDGETEDEDEIDKDDDKIVKQSLINNEKSNKQMDNDDIQLNPQRFLQTPSKSKAFSDVTNIYHKTPLKSSQTTITNKNKLFETPHNLPQSSPSTVIMSSCPRDDEIKTKENIPPSPTPKKEIKTATCKTIITGSESEPAMGLFSDTRPKKSVNSKAKNKAQMQAGMNKFQIVFTDVHTLMNNKNKKKSSNENGTNEIINNVDRNSNHENTSTSSVQMKSKVNSQAAANISFKKDKSYDHKDASIISGTSSTMNTSHLNMSTDHSSFELGGGSSTPNSKYLLDKMFEKPSPDNKNNFAYWQVQQNFAMPPPQRYNMPIQAQTSIQGMQNSSGITPYPMMVMSTPQHQSVIQYGSYNESPTNDFTNDINAFSYSSLQTGFIKDGRMKKD